MRDGGGQAEQPPSAGRGGLSVFLTDDAEPAAPFAMQPIEDPPEGSRWSPLPIVERHRGWFLALLAGLMVASVFLAYQSRSGGQQEAAADGVRSATTSTPSTTGSSPDPDEPESPAGPDASESDEPSRSSAGTAPPGTTTSLLDVFGSSSSAPSNTTTTRPTSSTATTSTTASTTTTTSSTGSTSTTTTSTGSTSVPTTAAPTTTTTIPTTTRPTVLTTRLGTNLVENGSFNQPALSTGFSITSVPGWTSTAGNSLEIWSPGHADVTAPGGTQLAELNASGPETYTQTVAVTPGATYRWSFQHRGRADQDSMQFRVVGTEVSQTITTGTAWRRYEGKVVAPSNSLQLSFRAIDQGSVGNLLTGVELRKID